VLLALVTGAPSLANANCPDYDHVDINRSTEAPLKFHFIFTTSERSAIKLLTKQTASGAWNARHTSCVESVLRHHPGASVVLHTDIEPEAVASLVARGHDVTIRPLHLAGLFQRGVLHELFNANANVAEGFVRHALVGAPHWY